MMILLCLLIIKMYHSYSPVIKYIAKEPIYRGNPNVKKIAFTCNVYWGNEYIPTLLGILRENEVKITFFIGGSWAKKFPQILKDIYYEGHEIGNHGYNHKNHKDLSLEENKKEIMEAEQIIEEIIGIKTRLFAPPYGEFNNETIKAAEELNYQIIMWSIDTIDWKKPGSDYIINKVLKKAHNGAIVLIHPTQDTVEALPTILEELKRAGYKLTTVTDIIPSKNN